MWKKIRENYHIVKDADVLRLKHNGVPYWHATVFISGTRKVDYSANFYRVRDAKIAVEIYMQCEYWTISDIKFD